MNKNAFYYKMAKSVYIGFRNVFSPFGYIRNYVFFPIMGFMRTFRWGYIYKKYSYIEELRGKYQGKRCFILATGPSLQISDIEELNDEITIAVNSFYKLYEKTSFRPTYYMALDPNAQNNLVQDCPYDIQDIARKGVFMNSMAKNKRENVQYLPICYQNHWFNIFNYNYDYSKNLKYTKNLLWGIYDKYTVTNAAIDLAIHMGCREIYLLGVDCNYSGPKNYCMEPTKDTFKPDEMQSFLTQKAMTAGYKFMEKKKKKRGIKIYNATRGGMLEEFERANFDDLIKINY